MQLYQNLSTAAEVLAEYLFEDEESYFQSVPFEGHRFMYVIDAMLAGLYPGEKATVEAEVADLLMAHGWFDDRFIDHIISEEIPGSGDKKTLRLSENFYAGPLCQQAEARKVPGIMYPPTSFCHDNDQRTAD